MTDWNAVDSLRALVEEPAPPGHPAATGEHVVTPGPHWVHVRPHEADPLPGEGWKLHISSRAATLPALAEVLLPRLLRERCRFKVVRSARALALMNDGQRSPASVGKAVTVYPSAGRVRGLGLELAALLRGHEGPRVLSDRRVAADAPVYYRYGPFRAQWHAGDKGTLVVRLHGADGEVFDAAATLDYRQPSWARDPFKPEAGPRDPAPDDPDHGEGAAEAPLLGGRYRVLEGLRESARGNVYRAEDIRAPGPAHGSARPTLVVKQARAYVAENADGVDVRARLRNERRVLETCAGVPGIPAFVDHFAHEADEYLVTTDAGDTNLLRHIRGNGALLPPVPGAGPGRGLGPGGEGSAARAERERRAERFARLCGDLATTLLALHERGVVMRDISPRNVVLGPRRAHLIDFGISALDGLHLPGGTPGFAPREQLDKTAEPRPQDDHFALGMVLAYAATGLLPVVGAATTRLARERQLACLAAVYGESRAALRATLAQLQSGDADAGRSALLALATQPPAQEPAPAAPPPAPAPASAPRPAGPPSRTAGTASRAHLAQAVREALLAGVADYQFGGEYADFPAVDASLYTGSAGVGLELLHHREEPGVAKVLDQLAAHAHDGLRRVALPPGLFSGRTGTELFLAGARAAGVAVPEGPLPGGTEWSAPEPETDVISGRAGVGLAALSLGDLDAAREQAGRLAALPPRTAPRDEDDASGSDPGFGYAHGFAGTTDLLLLVAARTPDDSALLSAAHAHARELARRTVQLAAASRGPEALPMVASWCRGLAGAARTLQHARELFAGETDFAPAAEQAALAAAEWVPRMETPGQCCGASGVGTMLVELARATGDGRWLEAAHEVADHLLRRSLGPDEAPALLNTELQETPYSWAQGYAGILTFLRRLEHPDSPGVLGPAASE
ncbi:class III lanthionine synthetase LanKC N-terminal domain-containing protein [Streptomyces reniochalinae]|uniref:Serine/threonine protein kinase n=1 Tax=Streptomyces reniochalinae TaxID=2250578 RepID=A0A367ECY7_9ACTN|nr:lanthionine synthetase LanC family protein [Streptomyces reniochalinae]RCG15924.1 serine/threonine protein kinase [Streptomyces reniochalinae]